MAVAFKLFGPLLTHTRRPTAVDNNAHTVTNDESIVCFLNDDHDAAIIQFHLKFEARNGANILFSSRTNRSTGQRTTKGRQLAATAATDRRTNHTTRNTANRGTRAGCFRLNRYFSNVQDCARVNIHRLPSFAPRVGFAALTGGLTASHCKKG